MSKVHFDPHYWRQILEQVKLRDGDTIAELTESISAIVRRAVKPDQQRKAAELIGNATRYYGCDQDWFRSWIELYLLLQNHNEGEVLIDWLRQGAPVSGAKPGQLKSAC